jgi:dephospho-CoA kinase
MIDKHFSIGLTGGIGSGKSLVADMFAALGAALIDTDQIAHQLTAPGGLAMPAIGAQFGADFIAANGAMDRARMRAAVFSDPAVKRRLEAILHPLIRIETERAAAEAQGAYRIFVVPLLVESGKWKERVSRVLVVDCPEELQLSRVMARNGLAEAQVRAIMAAQASRQARLDAADDVIVNDAGIAQLTPQVERLHALYCEMARGNPLAN